MLLVCLICKGWHIVSDKSTSSLDSHAAHRHPDRRQETSQGKLCLPFLICGGRTLVFNRLIADLLSEAKLLLKIKFLQSKNDFPTNLFNTCPLHFFIKLKPHICRPIKQTYPKFTSFLQILPVSLIFEISLCSLQRTKSVHLVFSPIKQQGRILFFVFPAKEHSGNALVVF